MPKPIHGMRTEPPVSVAQSVSLSTSGALVARKAVASRHVRLLVGSLLSSMKAPSIARPTAHAEKCHVATARPSLLALGSWVLGSCAAFLRRSSSRSVLALSCSSGHLNAHVPLEQLLSASASLALLQITMSSAAVPDPDAEVPKEVRDEFFKQMKSKQSERVRRGASANMPRPAHPRAHR